MGITKVATYSVVCQQGSSFAKAGFSVEVAAEEPCGEEEEEGGEDDPFDYHTSLGSVSIACVE